LSKKTLRWGQGGVKGWSQHGVKMESRRDQDGVKMKSSCVKMDGDKIGSTWGQRWSQMKSRELR